MKEITKGLEHKLFSGYRRVSLEKEEIEYLRELIEDYRKLEDSRQELYRLAMG